MKYILEAAEASLFYAKVVETGSKTTNFSKIRFKWKETSQL